MGLDVVCGGMKARTSDGFYIGALIVSMLGQLGFFFSLFGYLLYFIEKGCGHVLREVPCAPPPEHWGWLMIFTGIISALPVIAMIWKSIRDART